MSVRLTKRGWLVGLGAVALLLAIPGGEVAWTPVAPCAGPNGGGDHCEPRDVSAISLFSPPSAAAYEPVDIASVEEVLEKGLGLAEASPVHLAARATVQDGSLRCEWRGVARTPKQREEAIRFWLALDDTDPLPSAAEVECRFMAELDIINPIYPGTVRSNFRAIARGGESTEYQFLTCYADYTVQEYLLGPSLTGTQALTVAYDRLGEVRSYGLYMVAHAAGMFGKALRADPYIPASALLAALTQPFASGVSFSLGYYVVERIVTPLDGWDRVSDRNDKLKDGSLHSQPRPTMTYRIANSPV